MGIARLRIRPCASVPAQHWSQILAVEFQGQYFLQVYTETWTALKHSLGLKGEYGCLDKMSNALIDMLVADRHLYLILEAVPCFLDALEHMVHIAYVQLPDLHTEISSQVEKIKLEAAELLLAQQKADAKHFAKTLRRRYLCTVLNIVRLNASKVGQNGMFRHSDIEDFETEVRHELERWREGFKDIDKLSTAAVGDSDPDHRTATKV